MITTMIHGQPDPEDLRRFFRALQRAQRDIDVRPDLYTHYYRNEFPVRFHPLMDTRRWGPGERLVFEPYTKDVFDRTVQWIAEHGIFADGSHGLVRRTSSPIARPGAVGRPAAGRRRRETDEARMTSADTWDFDAAVIGGGPGGSSTATALARRGRRVLLLERDQFPRFHIGESQLPWSNEIFEALGVQETIAGGRASSASGARASGRSTASFEQYADFAEARETPTPQTFQVPRETFDDLLLRHCGEVRRGRPRAPSRARRDVRRRRA